MSSPASFKGHPLHPILVGFFRKHNGASDYEIIDKRGSLHVLRQPTPWSLTSTFAERLKDALLGLVPGK